MNGSNAPDSVGEVVHTRHTRSAPGTGSVDIDVVNEMARETASLWEREKFAVPAFCGIAKDVLARH